MITEDYVSFETTKLLKEKGYKGSFNGYYNNAGCVVDKPNTLLKEPEYQYYERVSLYMAMKWLKEVHNIFIGINVAYIGKYDRLTYLWIPCVIKQGHIDYPTMEEYMADSYEEAAETAIKYCLTNLI